MLAVCFSVIGALAVTQAPSQAATTGSYVNNYAGVDPQLYNVRTFMDGPTFTAPAGTPAGATITSVSASLAFTAQPTGMNYLVYLCADAADTQCANFSPTGSWYGQPTWPISGNTQLAGFPASTTLHYAVAITDGSTSSIKAALNPARYSLRQNTTVTYSY